MAKEQKDWERTWRKVKDDLKHVVIIASSEGGGKTHWAVENSPGPHYLIDTEGQHNLHTAVELDPELRAIVLKEEPEAGRDSKWFSGRGQMWSDLKLAALELVDAPPGTVIIDSASDLTAMVVSQFSIDWDRGDKAFPTMLYGQVYGEIGSIVSYLRERHHVVLTARLKEQYRGDEPTGKYTTAIWKQADYIAEHIIFVTSTENGRVYDVRRKKQPKVRLDHCNWEYLTEGIPQSVVQEAKLNDLKDKIVKGVQMIKDLGAEDRIPEHIRVLDLEDLTLDKAEAERAMLMELYLAVKAEKGKRRKASK